MQTYRVTWEIDIDAKTPRQAAEIARSYQIDPKTTAVVFNVADEEGNNHHIDLMEPEK